MSELMAQKTYGLKVTHVVQTCHACPSQWEGRLGDGRDLYIRYRYGHLTVEAGNPWWEGEEIYAEQVGHDLAGVISLDEVADLTGLDFDEAESGGNKEPLN